MAHSGFPQFIRGDRKASVTHKHQQILCMSFSLLFVILNFMVFLLLSVFVCFRQCHRCVRTLCVWFPQRRCSAKHREPPAGALRGPAPCHILTRRSWGRGKERGGRFCGLFQPWLFRGGPDLANGSSPNTGGHCSAAPWAPAPRPSSSRLGHPWRRFHPAGKPTRHKAWQSPFSDIFRGVSPTEGFISPGSLAGSCRTAEPQPPSGCVPGAAVSCGCISVQEVV